MEVKYTGKRTNRHPGIAHSWLYQHNYIFKKN